MSFSTLYKHANAFVAPEDQGKPVIELPAPLYAEIKAQLAALAPPEDELPHKESGAGSADYQCGLPDKMEEYTTANGLFVMKSIEKNGKTGFAIIFCLKTKKAIVVFGRRTFSNWCPYGVDGLGPWNESRFKLACATVFKNLPQWHDVTRDIFFAKEQRDAQKATNRFPKEYFDSAKWDAVSPEAMYKSLLLTCTNKEYFDTFIKVQQIIKEKLGLESLIGAVAFVEASMFDIIWGNGLSIFDFVKNVEATDMEGFDLLDAAKQGFGKGTNKLGAALTAIMHTVCEEVGDYEKMVELVNAAELVKVIGE
jgi:predicted NAD-dependent protein-ADP-ribosyltransferase YbiA (DUF1768 family)